MKNLFLLCGILVFITGNSWGIVGEAPMGPGSGAASSTPRELEGHAMDPSDITDCGEVDNYLAFKHLDLLVAGTNSPISITHDQGSGAIRVELGRYITNCMTIEFATHPRDGDYFLIAKNTYFDDLKIADRTKFDELYKGKNARQMYESCLKNEGAIDESGNWTNKIAYSNVQSSTFRNLELKKEGATHFYFGSNKNEITPPDAYGIPFGKVEVDNAHKCFQGEKIQEEEINLFANMEQEKAHNFFSDALNMGENEEEKESDCKACEYDMLVKVFSDLRAGTGNATALEDWMRNEFIKQMSEKLTTMVDERAIEINARLDVLDDQIKGSKTREDATEFVREYMKLLEELDKDYLAGRIVLLEDMYDCAADVTLSKENRDRCKDNVGDLKKDIKMFGTKHFLNDGVLRKLQKLGFSMEANEAKHFTLKSKYYGKYDGKNPEKPLSLIKKDLEKFERTSAEYEREYLARYEGENYSDLYKEQIKKDQNKIESFNEQYSTFIKETQAACQQTMYGYANPTKCKRNMEKATEVQKMWQNKVGRLSSRIARYGGVYEKYKGLEDAYTAEVEEYDDDYSLWDDDVLYYERYDESSSSSSTTNNNSWMQQSYNPTTQYQSYNPTMQYQGYGSTMQYPNYGSSMQYPNYGSTMQYPNYGSTMQYPNYGSTMQYPNYGSTMQYPDYNTMPMTTQPLAPAVAPSTGSYAPPAGFN